MLNQWFFPVLELQTFWQFNDKILLPLFYFCDCHTGCWHWCSSLVSNDKYLHLSCNLSLIAIILCLPPANQSSTNTHKCQLENNLYQAPQHNNLLTNLNTEKMKRFSFLCPTWKRKCFLNKKRTHFIHYVKQKSCSLT